MIAHDQPTPTSCFRACVATVLQCAVDFVPTACDGDAWDWDKFQEWLRDEFALQAVEIHIGEGSACFYPVVTPIPCIITGNSPRECTTGRHALVAEFIGLEGFRIIHDPHQSRAGIVGDPTHACFFVPMDLSDYFMIGVE